MDPGASKNPPPVELQSPTQAGSPLTRRRFLAGTGILLTGPALIASCGTTRADRGEPQPANTTATFFVMIDSSALAPNAYA